MNLFKNIDYDVKKRLFLIIVITLAIKTFIASNVEFGNDEVYYWTYALFPDWSHFDHPPMVGFTIQLFTLNLNFSHEFFIRLGGLVFGIINTLLVFLIARKAKDDNAGLFAAVLYNTSIYNSIIAGTFILPDTPMLLFYLIAEYLLFNSVISDNYENKEKKLFILAGLVIGLAALSKYHAVFLWVGLFIYFLLYSRKFFLKKETYIAVLISGLSIIPIIYWNYLSNFISFTYHGARVGAGPEIRIDYLASELLGGFAYNTPVNYIIIITSLWAVFKKKKFMDPNILRLGLAISLPMILTFLGFSLFKRTLPHWSGPGFVNLIIIASCYLSYLHENKLRNNKFYYPVSIKIAIGFVLIGLSLGYLQINRGIFTGKSDAGIKDLGHEDVSLDMYGWKQFKGEFEKFYTNDKNTFFKNSNPTIVSYRWFPSANLDYYVASPLNIKLLAFGELTDIHKYAWINKYRGYLNVGDNAYFITNSRDYRDPYKFLENSFQRIEPADTVAILRNGIICEYFTVYKLYGWTGVPENPIK